MPTTPDSPDSPGSPTSPGSPGSAASPGSPDSGTSPGSPGSAAGAPPAADAASVPPSVRLRLGVAYDGTDFHGWAPQPGARTVAHEVRTAMERLYGPLLAFVVAGRTDAGVHATGQVAHADVAADRWAQAPNRPLWRLRGILPPDVRVTSLDPVDAAFDARFSALGRHYVYRVADSEWGVSPLRRTDVLAWTRPLDVDAMSAAAGALLGEHDFAAYCKRREGATTIRALTALTVTRTAPGRVDVAVSADAFCHSMVRSLVGALLAVGDGRRPPEWPGGLLARTERSSEVAVAPAHGLTLLRVDYPDGPEGWRARDAVTRRVRVLGEDQPRRTANTR